MTLPFRATPAMLSWRTVGPYLVAMIWLIAGYLHYSAGTAYSLSAAHYRDWAFPAFRYSDIVWLYLRDNLRFRPLPYVDYPLEYPPLTGLLSWLLSWTPNLPSYFAGAYLVLAAGALATIWSLQRLAGANAWLFAASPALFFYTGHQWDLAAIAVTALALVAIQGNRRAPGVVGLALAVSLKLFPIVFFAALTVESLRDRRWGRALRDSVLFASVTLVINLPVAAANREGWSFFFRWNRDRLADSGIWVLWRDAATADLTRWSLAAAVTAAIALTIVAARQQGPLTVPLGVTYMIWWLLLNKTFTTHLMLWAILGVALVSAPVWLWALITAVDTVGFQVGNYLNLYNVPAFQHAPLIRMAVENIYDPLQIARTAVLAVTGIWLVRLLRDPGRRAAFSPPTLQPPRPRTAASYTPLLNVPATSQVNGFEVCCALLLFSITTIVMTWPYAAEAASATAVGFDPLLQIWLSEWIQHALTTNPTQIFAANMFFPFAQTLAYTDANIPGALVALPIRLLTGDPVLTNTVFVLTSFVIAGMGVFFLVRYLTGDRAIAAVMGLAYAFLPYRMVHLWHLNWLEGALFPWFILSLLWLIDRPAPIRAVVAGALAAALTLISFYFAPQILLVSTVLTASIWVSRRAWPDYRFYRATALAISIALLIAVPFLLPYVQVNQEQRLERTLADAEQYKALPESYLQLAPWTKPNPLQGALRVHPAPNLSLTEVGQSAHADGHRHAEIVSEDALYPGLLAMLFAVVALVWGRPRWLVAALSVIAIIAGLLSLGPSWGPHHASNPALPYAWLFEHVPIVRAMRVPARLGGLVDLALILLAASGMQAAWQRLRARVPADRAPFLGPSLATLAVICVLADVWPGHIPLEEIDRSPNTMSGAVWLASQPTGPVMEFPSESVFVDPAAASVRRHTGETLFRSTMHWFPMVNGNSGFIPSAYSDFIEGFVGALPRENGSTTGRVSHLEPDTLRLLQQIGVRYVVFNIDQYASGDWPAIARELDALVEQGLLATAGRRGNQQVYVVTPTAPRPPTPRIALFAPTLLTPGESWSPWIGFESSNVPSLLALTRPSQLSLEWYDALGKLLGTHQATLPLPAVMHEEHLLCSVRECLTARPFPDLDRLPQPEETGAWLPGQPGHYVVRAHVSGDLPLSCQIDLDVVEERPASSDGGGTARFRWAACVATSAFPVNDPGKPQFTLGEPHLSLSGNAIGVDYAVTARDDESLMAWFIISPRGLPDPWRVASYVSPVQEKRVRAGEQTTFDWNVTLAEPMPPGAYDVTVWVHHQLGGAWQHATGGLAMPDALIVEADGTMHRGGASTIQLSAPLTTLQPGTTMSLPIVVHPTPDSHTCVLEWQLVRPDGTQAQDGTIGCSPPIMTLQPNTLPGVYRLSISLVSEVDGQFEIDNGISTFVTVADFTDEHAD